jgi:hypothetical protein
MIGENLKEGDVALVMDADAMVTNLLLKVERFLENEKYLYLSDGVNCGIFVVRKTNWLSSFMQMCIKHIENGSYNCEQDRIEQYVKYHNDEHIKIVGHPCFNSFIPELYGHIENPEAITHEQGKWQNGDFICHLPALSMETRLQKMKELKEMIVR